jgi:tRNA U38,U39,U40 pseudouridine synthase TruA
MHMHMHAQMFAEDEIRELMQHLVLAAKKGKKQDIYSKK